MGTYGTSANNPQALLRCGLKNVPGHAAVTQTDCPPHTDTLYGNNKAYDFGRVNESPEGSGAYLKVTHAPEFLLTNPNSRISWYARKNPNNKHNSEDPDDLNYWIVEIQAFVYPDSVNDPFKVLSSLNTAIKHLDTRNIQGLSTSFSFLGSTSKSNPTKEFLVGKVGAQSVNGDFPPHIHHGADLSANPGETEWWSRTDGACPNPPGVPEFVVFVLASS